MLDKGSCFSPYHFVPWYLDKNTASSCCVICISVSEAGGRWREKRECKGKSKARRSAHIGLHQTGDNLGLLVGLERGRTGMCRNDPSKTLFEFSFNPFPLSGWTIPLIFNYMNGGLGSKESLPISWVLWTERALEKCDFSSICSVAQSYILPSIPVGTNCTSELTFFYPPLNDIPAEFRQCLIFNYSPTFFSFKIYPFSFLFQQAPAFCLLESRQCCHDFKFDTTIRSQIPSCS